MSKDEEKIYGLLRPANDAHTLGVSNVEELIRSCGATVKRAPDAVGQAVHAPKDPKSADILVDWLKRERITELGFSYRLDPDDAVRTFDAIFALLQKHGMFRGANRISNVFFAGLPRACDCIMEAYKGRVVCFFGDETPLETAEKLGLPPEKLPAQTSAGAAYDQNRLSFARELIKSGEYLDTKAPERGLYPEFGSAKDGALARVDSAHANGQSPLMRAHIGPYLPDRIEAVKLYLDWVGRLAKTGYLDVLSMGTSQLTQEQFGLDWKDQPNGGGVPINSEEEYRAIRQAASPMLVRTYAGTTNISDLAKMHERSLNIAWHALSFWWFCEIDGRGPLPVRENLRQHLETASYIATTGKPLEPNVPHHFAFRGADDITYVVSGVLAARAAANLGVKNIVVQIMLNTPRATWGVADLAKARTLLKLVRKIPGIRVLVQPRAGLDYFSPDLEKARVQLAAVSAMMDDIEPENYNSPDIIHVVSYSEAVQLADPDVVDESIKITLASLRRYRDMKAKSGVNILTDYPEAIERQEQLEADVCRVLQSIERTVENPYSSEGLYKTMRAGYLHTPYLWMRKEEFAEALRWKTGMIKGGVHVLDDLGKPAELDSVIGAAENAAREQKLSDRGVI